MKDARRRKYGYWSSDGFNKLQSLYVGVGIIVVLRCVNGDDVAEQGAGDNGIQSATSELDRRSVQGFTRDTGVKVTIRNEDDTAAQKRI